MDAGLPWQVANLFRVKSGGGSIPSFSVSKMSDSKKIDKQFFAEILLSRFLSMNDECGEFFLDALIEARKDLFEQIPKYSRIEDSELFTQWGETIKEIIFPEIIGPLKDKEGNEI